MPLTWQHATLHMEWCLDCHRHPERYVRPRDKVFDMTWQPPPNQLEIGREPGEGIQDPERQTDCSTCHR